jgi:acyl-CoA synthetase (AMP-forming)/AMP-acid ligase II
MGNTIYSRFRSVAIRQPDSPAILAPGKGFISFGELLDFIDVTKENLHAIGIGRGARLGVLMTERSQTAVAHIAAVSTCISVPINPESTPNELKELARSFKLDALITSEATAERFGTELLDLVPTLITTHVSDNSPLLFRLASQTVSSRVSDQLPTENDAAFLLQTAGTTGVPKIVPQTHLTRVTTSARIGKAFKMTPSDRCLNVMPMHHTQGLSAELIVPLTNGVSVVVDVFKAAQIQQTVAEFKPSWFNLVPSMHQSLLDELGGRTGVFADSSLRFVTSSSAKLAGAIRERLELAYGVPVAEQYGVTECSAVSYSGLPWNELRKDSVGQPLHDGVIIMDGNGVRLETGRRGEICVTGPSVIPGYEQNPDANAESFWGDWYRTGDEGYFDEDGFLYVTGRVVEVVNRGGEKFSLTEIDNALLRLTGITNAAAFMVPHSSLGHEVYAAVVMEEDTGILPGELRAQLAEHLSWARVPKRVFIVDQLPMNSVGKVLRQNLASELMAGNSG